MVVHGASYPIVSMSCTLGVLLSVVAQATSTAGPAQLIGVFAAYSAGAATIFVGLAVATVSATATFARWARRVAPLAATALTASAPTRTAEPSRPHQR